MTPVLVFDGDCAFCSSSARWVQRWAPSRRAEVVAWQHTDLGAIGLTAQECSTALRWVDGERHSAGPVAVADYLRTARAPWPALGAVLGTRLATAAAWPVYRWVAEHRHQLPGGTPQCALPTGPRPDEAAGGAGR
ncbi:thiol-disulfide oxidoreductase DCC family protein [Mumia sp. Pv 4-285]|uniref:thiol-disulfide oxidoreductase DCC family protein n=1 Tax=Mumia qirimensis TaxID=3234852 RepID=UPI00351D1D45